MGSKEDIHVFRASAIYNRKFGLLANLVRFFLLKWKFYYK
jgi:hypothetical protein